MHHYAAQWMHFMALNWRSLRTRFTLITSQFSHASIFRLCQYYGQYHDVNAGSATGTRTKNENFPITPTALFVARDSILSLPIGVKTTKNFHFVYSAVLLAQYIAVLFTVRLHFIIDSRPCLTFLLSNSTGKTKSTHGYSTYTV